MTSANTAATDIPPSVFLDSSVLVSLFQFWEACRGADVDLNEVRDWKQLIEALKSVGVTTNSLNSPDPTINRGLQSFQRLHASVPDYLYFSSRVCWSQAHHVLLEARGLENLIRQGVPQSLRMKRPQTLYRISLQELDYTNLEKQFEEFRYTLKMDFALDIVDVEDTTAGSIITPDHIWDSAKAIWSRILMEVSDAYVCAAAILARVDFFVSKDSSLRELFNLLHDTDEDWSATATSLTQALGMTSTVLPKALTPASAFPRN